MRRFITRVELKNSKDADYTDLHREMEARGFSRNLPGAVGAEATPVVRGLPSATYWCEIDLLVSHIRDRAAEATRAIKKNAAIIVVEVTTWAAEGLEAAHQSTP